MRRILVLLMAVLVSACQSSATSIITPTAVERDAELETLAPISVPEKGGDASTGTFPPALPLRREGSLEGWTRIGMADGLPSEDILTVAAAAIISTGIEQSCILFMSPLANSVWVGTNGAGLAYWDGTHWNTVTTTTPGASLVSNVVQAFWIMPRGRVLIGTDRGLSTYCQQKDSIRWSFGVEWTPPTNSVQAITVAGPYHFYGHPEGVRGMYQGRVYDQLFTTASTPIGLGANDTRALVGDASRSRIWAGSMGGGLAVFTAVQRPFRVRETLTTANSGIGSNLVTSLAYDRTMGVLWLGHAPDTQTGRPGGVTRYDETAPAETRWQVFTAASGALPSDDVRAVAIDRDRDVWVGTAHGLARRSAADGVWTHYTVETTQGGLGSNSISGIAVATDGTRWFSTRGGGVARLASGPPRSLTPSPSPTRGEGSQTPTPTLTLTPIPSPTRGEGSQTPTPTPVAHALFMPHVLRQGSAE